MEIALRKQQKRGNEPGIQLSLSNGAAGPPQKNPIHDIVVAGRFSPFRELCRHLMLSPGGNVEGE
jgi:hypothetical protein